MPSRLSRGIATPFATSVVVMVASALAACSSSSDTGPAQSTAQSVAPLSLGLTAPSWAKPERFVDRVAAGESLSLQVHLQMHDEAGARAELDAISDPKSPRYGQFLSDADFAAKYAPTEADVAVVRAHLEANGLTVTHVPGNRAYIAATGTTAQVEAAFSTRLGHYTVNGETRRAPLDAAVLPYEVGSRVKTVLGLSTPAKMKPSLVRAPQVTAKDSTNNTCSTYYGQYKDTTDQAYGGGFPDPLPYGQCSGYVPSQIRHAYGLDDAVAAGFDGRGQKVAIVDAWLSPTLLQDAQQYATNNDPSYPLASSQFTATWAPGTPVNDPCDAEGWYGEQSLDVEAVHAMAPGADIQFVGAQSDSDEDLIAALNLVIDNRLASVISNSWGGAEYGLEPSDTQPYEAMALQAGLKGIGLYFASGDEGDDQLAYGLPSPTVTFPSMADVTIVGGTSIALGKRNETLFDTAWESGVSFLVPDGYTGTWPPSGSGGGGGGSCGEAKRPVSPAPASASSSAGTSTGLEWWPAPPGGYYFGSGGGTSVLYAQPDFQRGIVPDSLAEVGGKKWRVVPDVAMLGDPETGFQIGQTSDGTYSEYDIGGTSLATPLFTATIALAQQVLGRHFGSANRALYRSARNGGFQDITPTRPQAIAYPGGVVVTFDFKGQGSSLATTFGFDNTTGLGSPSGIGFFFSLL